MINAALVSITGRVQGVGYRAWAVRQAQKRGLRGWVRNRLDGSVEVMIIGDESEIADMIAACRKGPSLAQVENVAPRPAQDDGSVGFTDRPTE
jgi:acylphosphatase